MTADMTTNGNNTTTTKPGHQPSSPREFFQKIYGDLENKSETPICMTRAKVRSETDLIAPIPILASPFLFPPGSESQLAAAAAGLSAFRKYSNIFLT